MKKPAQEQRRLLNKAQRNALAERASYTGSEEHKTKRWWGGLPGVRYDKDGNAVRYKRQKTTICDLVTEADRRRATEWVRAAIRSGQYKFLEGDQDFPKHVWYQADGRGWFGFCTNPAAGEYKGWPMEEDERRAYFT